MKFRLSKVISEQLQQITRNSCKWNETRNSKEFKEKKKFFFFFHCSNTQMYVFEY